MSIPGQEAVVRFQENEDRLNTFLNTQLEYVTNLGEPVESIPHLIGRLQNTLDMQSILDAIGNGDQSVTDSFIVADNLVRSDLNTTIALSETASKLYIDLKEIELKAYADGIVTAEEARAIADAKAKYDAAKLLADNAQLAADAARLVADKAQTILAGISDDGLFTNQERPVLRDNLAALKAQWETVYQSAVLRGVNTTSLNEYKTNVWRPAYQYFATLVYTIPNASNYDTYGSVVLGTVLPNTVDPVTIPTGWNTYNSGLHNVITSLLNEIANVIATNSKAGIVKVGSTLTVDGSGVISLPIATGTVLGGIKSSASIQIAADGTATAVATVGATAFSAITGAPTDNTALSTTLAAKANLAGAAFTGGISATTGTFTGAPGISIAPGAGNWCYERFNNGSIFWDLATINSMVGNQAANNIGFRFNGGDAQWQVNSTGNTSQTGGLSATTGTFSGTSASDLEVLALKNTAATGPVTRTKLNMYANNGTLTVIGATFALSGSSWAYGSNAAPNQLEIMSYGSGGTAFHINSGASYKWCSSASGDEGTWALGMTLTAAGALSVTGGISATTGTFTGLVATQNNFYSSKNGADTATFMLNNPGQLIGLGNWKSGYAKIAQTTGTGAWDTSGSYDACELVLGRNNNLVYHSGNIEQSASALMAAQAAALAPQWVASLPALPDAKYPKSIYNAVTGRYDGGMVCIISTKAMYQNRDNAWVSVGSDYAIFGQVTAAQIYTQSIGAGSLVADLVMSTKIRTTGSAKGTATSAPNGVWIDGNPYTATCLNNADGSSRSLANCNMEIGGNVNFAGYPLSTLAVAKLVNGGIVSFPAAGTYYWTCPTGITQVELTLTAGGGSGSANMISLTYANGGGGGGSIRSIVPVTPGTTYSIVIGAGGAAVTWSSGKAGENSTAFGLTVYGGAGGATQGLGGDGGAGGIQAGGVAVSHAIGTSTQAVAGFDPILSSGGASGGAFGKNGGSCTGKPGGLGDNINGGGGGASAFGAGGNSSETGGGNGQGYGAGGAGQNSFQTYPSGAGAGGWGMIRF